MTCCEQVAVGASGATIPTAITPSSVVIRHCDVCFLLDGDKSPKEVMYCKLCDKFMCAACRPNMRRRSAAVIAFKVTQFINKLKG
jgi:hypothetical protein